MSKEKELKEQNELPTGSPVIHAEEVKEPFLAHETHETHETNGTTNGWPCQSFNITQHIYSTPSYSHKESCPVHERGEASMILYIFKKLTQLSKKKLVKLIALVKEYSRTFAKSESWEIIDFLDVSLKKLTLEQLQYLLLKVEFEEEPDVESIEYKLAEIISAARSMTKENFDKLIKSIMESPAFKTEAEKINLVEILKKIRSMTGTEFEEFIGMVKDSSITPTIAKIEELLKTYTQLRQLTIEQIDEVFKMVKELSIA